MTTKMTRMTYEVWPGKTGKDPYEIRETWHRENIDGKEESFCGKTVKFFEDFVSALTECTQLNKLL